MTENEQMLEQILKAYDQGQINFSNVPAIQTIIRKEVAKQVAQTVKPAQIQEQASQQLKSDRTSYAQQVNKILQGQQERLQQQAQQINVEEVKKQLLAEIEQQRKAVEEAQADLDDKQARLAEREKKQFWRELIPDLASVLVSLFFAVMILLLFKALIWDGVWHGLGLNKVAEFVLTLAKTHPFGGSILGLILMVLIAGAIVLAFGLMVDAVQKLKEWDVNKLMFWRDDRY